MNAPQGSINFGHTYCQKNPEFVKLVPASGEFPLIFIDHVAYGKPLEPPNYDTYNGVCKGFYAENTDKVSKF